MNYDEESTTLHQTFGQLQVFLTEHFRQYEFTSSAPLNLRWLAMNAGEGQWMIDFLSVFGWSEKQADVDAALIEAEISEHFPNLRIHRFKRNPTAILFVIEPVDEMVFKLQFCGETHHV